MKGLRATLLIVLSALAAKAIGDEHRIGGKSAAEVFADPVVLRLVKAACAGDTEEVDKAVKDGADVNYSGYRHTGPLFWVLTCRNYPGIEQLLRLGANPNFQNDQMPSATWFAAGSDDPHLLELLLQHGGNPNVEFDEDTALEIAVKQKRAANLKLLLDAGADIDHADEVGRSAAVVAAGILRYDLVAYLLEKGYKHDLIYLARSVQDAVLPPGSSAAAERQHVLDMLKERGVAFPLPPVVPPPPPDIDKLRGRSKE